MPKSRQAHGPRIDHLIGQAPPEARHPLCLPVAAQAGQLGLGCGRLGLDLAAPRFPRSDREIRLEY